MAHGWKESKTTYLAAIIKIGSKEIAKTPIMEVILQEFSKGRTLELPKGLPSQYVVDHNIGVVISTRLSAKALYRMSTRQVCW